MGHDLASPVASVKIMAAPNGARRTKSDHHALPMSAAELAAEARACQQAGASALHMHVRDTLGRHSLDPVLYREAIAEVRDAAPGLFLQITTEAVGRYSVAAQFDCLREVVPEGASVSTREMARDVETAGRLYAFAAEAGIALQHILYDLADLQTLRSFRAGGVIPPGECSVLLVFGTYEPPVPARVDAVPEAVEALERGFPDWAACAFGPTEEPVLVEVAKRGGNVRIGFENNIHRPDGTLAVSTADNIRHFRSALARASGSEELAQTR
ncbi:3-keto-5-aminohexanoate cleavage protein [Mameliella alba]|nr:3-keto-5-aminohexanoate cleavage protein [Mameliella alba]OWV53783.1 3-keto-5-aminohexanoate cleavage protein [Mameliella alba]